MVWNIMNNRYTSWIIPQVEYEEASVYTMSDSLYSPFCSLLDARQR